MMLYNRYTGSAPAKPKRQSAGLASAVKKATDRLASDLLFLLISYTLVLYNGNQQLLTAGFGLSHHHLLILAHHLHAVSQ